MTIQFGNLLLEQVPGSPTLFDVIVLKKIEEGKMKGKFRREIISHSMPLAFAATEAAYKMVADENEEITLQRFVVELKKAQDKFIDALEEYRKTNLKKDGNRA